MVLKREYFVALLILLFNFVITIHNTYAIGAGSTEVVELTPVDPGTSLFNPSEITYVFSY